MSAPLILIAEDDVTLRQGLVDLLEAEHYRVCAAADGRQALELYRREKPDLLLLDVMMPEMSGDVVLQNLRKLPGLQDTPAIFMTARAQRNEIVDLKALGAIEVILKPFDPITLPDQIKTALSIS
ncbi:MAG: response regulator, partial [Amylibacter sp.]